MQTDLRTNGPKLVARAPLIAALYAVAPADAARVNGWLASQTKLPHLVRGVRTRWVSHDVAAAFAAVMESAERFQNKAVSARCMRLSLLRFAVRLVRERPAPQIAIGGAAIHLEDSYGAQLSTLLRANGETIDESSLTKLVEQATRELLTATPKPHPGPPVLTPIERCKTCANLDQRIALDYERGAVRPSILDSLVPIATMRTDESSESWGVRSVLRCRSCGTFYSVVRSKDEGHSFMDPTHDTEAITRLSLHAAIDTLGMFGGPGAAEARAAHALRVALVTEALVAMIARDAAPNWHLQKYACECLTQAALLNDDRDLLESLLVRNPNPIVRVHIALELVELAHGFQPYVGRGALKQTLEQAARGWLAEHSLTPVLAGVLAVAPLPSLRPSSVGDQTVATDTHAIALKALGIAADLAQRIDDDAFERVIEQLGSASEEHRFEAVWALIWIVKAAPVRGSAIRAQLDQLPAAVRALPVMGLLAGKVR